MSTAITARDVTDMCRHHLGCPIDGYLGSGYGSDLKSLLQTPMASGLADGVIAKAKADVPLLETAAPDSVNVYMQDLGMDKKGLFFEVSGELVPMDGGTAVAPAPLVSSVPNIVSPTDSVSEVAAGKLNTLVNQTLSGQTYF